VPLPPRPEGEPDGAIARERQAQAYADVLHAAARDLLAQYPCDFIYERYSLWSDVGARLHYETGLSLVLEVNAPLRMEALRYRNLSDDPLAARIEETQFEAAHAISVVSEPLGEYVSGRGAGNGQVHVLPNAVDPVRFHPAVRGEAVRDRYNLNDRFVVGFVGRPRPWHDLDCLCAAFARLYATDHRYHLLLVGEMAPEMAARLEQQGLRDAVSMTGPLPHSVIPQHIAAMDVAVSPHPPLTDFYYSPLKLFEYMACGVPVVAADIGQPAHIIHHRETGYLYPPGDAAVLADYIRALVDRLRRARRIAWQGAVYVLQNHTWDDNARAVTGWVEPQQDEREPDSTISPLPILDRKMRRWLYRATRPDLAAPLLADRLPAFVRGGPEQLQSVEKIRILKYKPARRCVLAYELVGLAKRDQRPTRHQVIGKVFRDERGSRLFRVQQQLWLNGFGPDAGDGIHVPRPLAYVPEMRMLVQERAPGVTLNKLVMDRNIKPLMLRCAEGLAKLHDFVAVDGPDGNGSKTYFLADELDSLDRFANELVEVRPQSVSKVAILLDGLRAWADKPTLPAATAVHRDFYYSQVLFDGPRLTLIDFDLFALGDPAIDVANFAAHLHFLGLQHLGHLDALASEAVSFVVAYTRFRPVDGDFLRRFAFYQAATFFRLMKMVAPRPGLAHHFDALYRRTAECLEVA
jgi:glycosyltransferase involved in cell wall biosynthesis